MGGAEARLAVKTAVASCGAETRSPLPRGVAQFGQNLNVRSGTAAPQFGQGGAVGDTEASSLTPQYAQKGIVPSTSWSQELHFGALVPAAPPAGYTRVAGRPPAASGETTAIADADSGFPQSMQKRLPESLLRPQWAHVVTTGEASAKNGVG